MLFILLKNRNQNIFKHSMPLKAPKNQPYLVSEVQKNFKNSKNGRKSTHENLVVIMLRTMMTESSLENPVSLIRLFLDASLSLMRFTVSTVKPVLSGQSKRQKIVF